MNQHFKLLICGSRDIKDFNSMFKKLDFLLSNKNLANVEIVHGGQKSYDKSTGESYGADYLAGVYANENKIEETVFLAPWDGLEDTPKSAMRKNKYGKLYWPGAGMYRNKQMANYNPDACVGFLGKNSKNIGTKNMLNICEKQGILTKNYYL